MPVLIVNAITFVFGLIFPGAPSWIAKVFATAIPAVIDAVRELQSQSASGKDKKSATIESVRELLDEGLDDVPGWKELGEEKRDQLIDAMIDLVYFVVKAEDPVAHEKATKAGPAKPLDIGKLIQKLFAKKQK